MLVEVLQIGERFATRVGIALERLCCMVLSVMSFQSPLSGQL